MKYNIKTRMNEKHIEESLWAEMGIMTKAKLDMFISESIEKKRSIPTNAQVRDMYYKWSQQK